MPNFPDNRPVLNPNEFEILHNILLNTGHPAQYGMINDIIENQQIDATILIGEGGIGKSSILAQLFRASRTILENRYPKITNIKQGKESLATKVTLEKYKNHVIPALMPFDWFVHQVVEQKAGKHQSTWDPSEWEEVSAQILSKMEPKLMEITHHNLGAEIYGKGPRWHLVSDPVVLGDLDKGREAVRVLARHQNVRVLGLISDPDNKNRAKRLREAITQSGLSPEKIQQIFLSEGVELDINDFGRVPDLMRKMANSTLMSASDMQVERQIDNLVEKGVIDFENYPLPEPVIDKIFKQTPPEQVDAKIAYYKRRYPHMLWVLRGQLMVPQPRVHALFNINMNDKVIHWYQKDLEKAMQMSA